MRAVPEAPDRTEARADLLATLARHIDHGHTVPCLDVPGPERGVWTSDDPTEQTLAASLCEPCPGLTACREYGTTYPREAGTYGGRTEHDRRTRVDRPKRKAS